ncbi:MAG: hypothetical protein ACRC4L_01675, partial [Mycoplasma sp.]
NKKIVQVVTPTITLKKDDPRDQFNKEGGISNFEALEEFFFENDEESSNKSSYEGIPSTPSNLINRKNLEKFFNVAGYPEDTYFILHYFNNTPSAGLIDLDTTQPDWYYRMNFTAISIADWREETSPKPNYMESTSDHSTKLFKKGTKYSFDFELGKKHTSKYEFIKNYDKDQILDIAKDLANNQTATSLTELNGAIIDNVKLAEYLTISGYKEVAAPVIKWKIKNDIFTPEICIDRWYEDSSRYTEDKIISFDNFNPVK